MEGKDESLVVESIRKNVLLMKESYTNDKIMAAHKLLLHIDSTIASLSTETIQLATLKELDNEPCIKEIRRVGSQVQNLFTLMTTGICNSSSKYKSINYFKHTNFKTGFKIN